MTNAERIQANNAELQECLNLAKNIIKPSGTLTIDKNGTHDVTAFESVDVNVAGAGGMEFNIAYGDVAPEDTSKLWVKCEESSGYIVSKTVDHYIPVMTKLPRELHGMVSATVGDKVYLFGGSYTYNSTYLSVDSIYRFDMDTKEIVELPVRLPQAMHGAASAVVGDKVYLLGGISVTTVTDSTRLNTILCYDTVTEVFKPMTATLPTALTGVAAGVIDDKIYLFGGVASSYSNKIYCFDTVTETVETSSTTLTKTLTGAISVVNGNEVYLLGGMQNGSIVSTGVYVFNASSNTIASRGTLPRAFVKSAPAVVENKVYLFGGGTNNNVDSDEIYVYDMATRACTILSSTLPQRMRLMASAVDGPKIYLFGGDSADTSTMFDTIMCFDCKTINLSQGKIHIIPSESQNVFPIINDAKIAMTMGVESVYVGNTNDRGEPVEAYLYKENEWKLI